MATYKCAQCAKETVQFDRPDIRIYCSNTAFHKGHVHVQMTKVKGGK